MFTQISNQLVTYRLRCAPTVTVTDSPIHIILPVIAEMRTRLEDRDAEIGNRMKRATEHPRVEDCESSSTAGL